MGVERGRYDYSPIYYSEEWCCATWQNPWQNRWWRHIWTEKFQLHLSEKNYYVWQPQLKKVVFAAVLCTSTIICHCVMSSSPLPTLALGFGMWETVGWCLPVCWLSVWVCVHWMCLEFLCGYKACAFPLVKWLMAVLGELDEALHHSWNKDWEKRKGTQQWR